jgi:hypothetical protein
MEEKSVAEEGKIGSAWENFMAASSSEGLRNQPLRFAAGAT